MGQYDRIAFPYHAGKYTNPGAESLLKTYCAIMGHSLKDLTVYQGSFNTGVAASAGTHDKADCIDLSASNAAEKTKTLKLIGFAAWHRTPAQGFSDHVHGVRMFSSAMAWLATAQDKAYRDHKSNGLGNLSHTDTSWCPRYRSIYHLSGPTSTEYYAATDTPGYSQPGCTPVGDKDLIRMTEQRKYKLSTIAGSVRCNGKDYFVTNGRTFFLESDFIRAWSGFNWKNQAFNVENAPAYGRIGPGLDKANKPGCIRDKGYLVRSIGWADRAGKIYVCTSHGTWYAQDSLKEIVA